MKMREVFIDFETYYDGEYSLKKLTTIEFIKNSKFKVHGVAVKAGSSSFWFTFEDFLDWARGGIRPDTLVVGHNLMFDAAILRWVCGIEHELF
ncbi:MAG: hypothetical protein QW318_07765, partial [Candidatus Caldarchaeum sp.]